MNQKENLQKEEERIRRLMQSGRIRASENLKHRIMHQIEVEKMLTRQRATPNQTTPLLKDFKAIFGTMYALLFGFSIFTLLFHGKEAIGSFQFMWVASLIFLVSSVFWGLTRMDAWLRKKKTNRS